MLASTSSIYGANEHVPFGETDRADEQYTLYAATKKSMELIAHSYAHLHHIPTTAFRFFTVYGPYGRPDMALFKFVSNILNDRPIQVYGEGRMQRDFTYIDDLVEAVLRLVPVRPHEENRIADIDSLSRHAPFRVVNIGGGQPVELLDFIDIIGKATGRDVQKVMMPMQLGDVPRTDARMDLLQALTGFTPRIQIEDGVQRFVDWYRTEYTQSQ